MAWQATVMMIAKVLPQELKKRPSDAKAVEGVYPA